MSPSVIEVVATSLFALALLHTFSVAWFERLAHRQPAHARLYHLLGEVEVVFGFWAFVLVAALMLLAGKQAGIEYVDDRNYTEPLFVFAIMVVAASKPVLGAARLLTLGLARTLPLPRAAAIYFAALSLIPLLGSLLTEPGAMTLAALLLRDLYYRHGLSKRMLYGTIGVLFVNISIGGSLTPFAAPPVLMVAATWGWDLSFMLRTFGEHVLPIVLINAAAASFVFRRELATVPAPAKDAGVAMPAAMIGLHLALLGGIVVFAHHPPIFLGLMLLFLGLASAYPQYQDRILLREALLVAFFLAGLVVLGGLQQWWLKPLLERLGPIQIYLGATALTALTDNAALTYLAAQVPTLDEASRYYVVAGALSGGGLTVIANAPNPAGMAILRPFFPDEAVNPGGLFLAALPPTLLTMAFFLLF
ncbi:MAG: putative Na+/H+ antiporter [Nevskia sp.]